MVGIREKFTPPSCTVAARNGVYPRIKSRRPYLVSWRTGLRTNEGRGVCVYINISGLPKVVVGACRKFFYIVVLTRYFFGVESILGPEGINSEFIFVCIVVINS